MANTFLETTKSKLRGFIPNTKDRNAVIEEDQQMTQTTLPSAFAPTNQIDAFRGIFPTQTQAPTQTSALGSVSAPPVVAPPPQVDNATEQARGLTQQAPPAPTVPENIDFRTLGRGTGAEVSDGRTEEFREGLGASTLGDTPADNRLQDLQMQTLEGLIDVIGQQPSADSIMGRYEERRQQTEKATEAARGLIEADFIEAEEEAQKLGEREVTTARESRRGFATNTAFLEQVEAGGTKRIRDLSRERDRKLAMNDIVGAERINDLLFKEEEAITDARLNFITNSIGLLGAVQGVAGFETPQETREGNLENALSLFANQQAIGQQFDDRQAVTNLKTQFANIDGIEGANNLSEIIGFIGPEIATDKNLQQQVLQAQIASSQASTQNALNSAGSKELPAGQVVNLSDAHFLPGLLDETEQTIIDNENLIGLLSGRLLGENRSIVKAELLRVAQLVGKFMEGGVLRKEDEKKYSKMLPQLSDQNVRVSLSKLQGVRDMLSLKYNGYLTDFSGSGFDVSGFNPISFQKDDFNTVVDGQTYQFSSQEDLDAFNAQVGQ